ncbi:MAG: hypothetical protein JW717_10790, partial [Marinilabiliaceae bacterium]|nr:hypothetical protein [Marinilabiliaceae bacterium]
MRNIFTIERYSKLIASVLLFWFVVVGTNAQQTWYTLMDGLWNDSTTWTLDPAGAIWVNPDGVWPDGTDNVVIKSGKKVTVPDGVSPYSEDLDGLTCGIVTVNGELDLGASSGHTFTEVKGSGRIYIESNNFPVADWTHFITKDKGNGTVVLRGSSFTLTGGHTFCNLEVKDTIGGNTYIIDENLTLNGNLNVIKGTLQINGTGTTVRADTIRGNVTIQSNGAMTVGTSSGAVYHWLNVYGDFTNYGLVDFSNSGQYINEVENGAVKLKFLGATDNNLICNGTTDLYRLFLNKGSDQTYTLTVNADDVSHFALFGPVGGLSIDGDDGTEGWERLPLVIYSGTLKLESNIEIQRLGEDREGVSPREFHIPYNGCLWINGATVSTTIDPGHWRGVTVFGRLKVSSGSFTTPSGTGGITYFSNDGEPGVLEISGGNVYTTQLKEANASGQFRYIQSDGTMHINALSNSRNTSAIFALPQESHVFEMTGGKIIIDAVNTTDINGIDIGVGEGNYNVTGGTIEIQTPTLDDASETQFEISSTAPFYNLTLSQSAHGGSQSVALLSDLTVLNDLSVGTGVVFDASESVLSVGGNLDVDAGGTYTQTTGTITFTGGANSIINNVDAINFYNLTVNKNDVITPDTWYEVSTGGTGAVTI